MATTLNVKLSDTLASTLSHQGVYAYAVTFDGNGMVGAPTTIVDGSGTTPIVNNTVQVNLPSTLNGGKIYFIIQSVDAGDASGLFGAGGAISQESDINWNNASTYDFRYDSFEVSLLGLAGDAGNLTDVNVFGIPMAVTIGYPNGASTQTRGYAVNGSAIFDDISTTLIHPYSEGPLEGNNRLAAAPATALASGGPGGASASDWNAYVQSLGAAVNAGTVTVRLGGYFNGAPSVDYMTYNGNTVQYMEYHNPGFYAYTASWTPGTGTTGTLVLTPESNSQIQGIISISSADLANSIYATLGNATVSNGTTNYQFSSLTPGTGAVAIGPDMNTGTNNQWGATFVKLLTGFIGGYLGSTNTPLNSLLGSNPVNLSLNWNEDPTFAFHGSVPAGQPGAVTPWTWNTTTYGTGNVFDPYAQVFFDNTNSYGNGYSDALMALFQQGGPLVSTGYSFALGSNPFTTTNGSSLVTVTDPNAANYAAVGALVSFGGVPAFANVNMNQVFTINSVISATQYQVQLPSGTANASGPGGGSAVVGATNVQSITIELFDDNEPNPPTGTLAQEQGYTPTEIYNTYDSTVGPLVTSLTSTGAPNLSLILSMGVGTMRVDPDATVTLGFYTGTTGGLAQFTQVEIPTSETQTLYQTWNFSNGSTPTFVAVQGASPAGNILQINALPYDTGVNWYQLTISNDGVSRTYNMYMNAEKNSGVVNPQVPGNDPGSIALDNLAALPANLGVQPYLLAVNVGLFNGGTVSLDPALMEQVTDQSIITANPAIWIQPDAPVLGTLSGQTFTNWGSYTVNVANPSAALGDVTTGALAFGWMGSDQQWVGYNASQTTPVNVIGGYTNKVGGSNVAYVTFQGTGAPKPQALAADIDGKWMSAKPVNFVNGTYTATMTEYAAGDTTYSTPLNLTSDPLTFTVNLATLALQAAAGGTALQLDAGASTTRGNWLELRTGASSLSHDASIVVYATDAHGMLVSRDGLRTGAGVTIQDAIRTRLGWIVDDNGAPMLKGTNAVYLPDGLQLHFAVEHDGIIDLASAVKLRRAADGSYSVDVNGLRISAEIDNTLDPSLVLAETQRATDQPLMWLRHGEMLQADVKGDSDFGRSTFGLVRIDVDPVTGAWSVGGVAYGNTAAFADAVRNNLDAGFRYQAGGDFAQTRTWEVAGADGYFAPVLINKLGEVIVAGSANPGGAVQIKTIGANTFAIENRTVGNKSDGDFNDFTVRFTTTDKARTVRQTVAQFFDPNNRVLASADTVILQDTAAALQALTAKELASLDDAGGTVKIDAIDNAITLSLSQYMALGDTQLTKGDRVTIADTGARFSRMLVSDIAELHARGVDRLDAIDGEFAFNVAQARALFGTELVPDDIARLVDSGMNLAQLTPEMIRDFAEVFEIMRATDRRIALNPPQFESLGPMQISPDDLLALSGSSGNDRFLFRRQVLGASDRVNGGAGIDQLVLDGDYSSGLALQAATISEIEKLSFGAGHDYKLKFADGNVAAGQVFTISAAGLGAGDDVIFDGSAEKDGRFTYVGGAGNSTFTGGSGKDRFTAGSGVDTVRYTASSQSTSLGYDTVVNFNAAMDRFDVWRGVTGVDAPVTQGALYNSTFDANLSAAMSNLGAHHAGLFMADSGYLAGVQFAVIDYNGVKGYQAGVDGVVKLEGATNLGSFGVGNFV